MSVSRYRHESLTVNVELPPGDDEAPSTPVRSIASVGCARNGPDEPWSAPRLYFGSGANNLTRAEWNRARAAIDQAFSELEVRCGQLSGHPSGWPPGHAQVPSDALARSMGRAGSVEYAATCQACRHAHAPPKEKTP